MTKTAPTGADASDHPLGRIRGALADRLGEQRVRRWLGDAELHLEGNELEVRTRLETDSGTASGFVWTSGDGPELRITAGTSARTTVTLEERAPITLLIPALRGWLGLD